MGLDIGLSIINGFPLLDIFDFQNREITVQVYDRYTGKPDGIQTNYEDVFIRKSTGEIIKIDNLSDYIEENFKLQLFRCNSIADAIIGEEFKSLFYERPQDAIIKLPKIPEDGNFVIDNQVSKYLLWMEASY